VREVELLMLGIVKEFKVVLKEGGGVRVGAGKEDALTG
jgi:hypothetical protein